MPSRIVKRASRRQGFLSRALFRFGRIERMDTEPPPLIPYYWHSERLTLRELWQKAPQRFAFLACLVGNLAVCFGLSLFVGGDSLGTTPSSQGYVVADHGRYTHVSHRIWLFMLFYPSTTLLVTALGIVIVIATLIRGAFGEQRLVARFALLVSLPLGMWIYAIVRNTCFSVLDDCGLHRIWPVMAWTLRVIAVAVFVALIVEAWRERKREKRLWLMRWGRKLVPEPIVKRA